MQLRKIVSSALVFVLFSSLCSCAQITRRDAADKAVCTYLAEHWPNEDFVPKYYINLFGRASDFYYRAVSAASPDTWFTVQYQSDVGTVIDCYEDDMERGQQGYHTIERLLSEYEDIVHNLLESNEFSGCHVSISCDYNAFLELWKDGNAVLDMPFSPELPISWSIEVSFDIKSDKPLNSQETAAEIQRAQGILSEAGYRFSTCGFTVYWWNGGELTELEH